MDKINRRINMEKHILQVLKTQKELFVSDLEYIKKLKIKYSNE